MDGVPDGALGGLVSLAITTAVAAVVIAALFRVGAMSRLVVAALRRLGLVATPPPRPAGMPLERIARDLRRLRRSARHSPGEPMARHRGALAAYDDALLDACRALDIGTDLADLPEGVDREAERLRVEAALGEAGIDLA